MSMTVHSTYQRLPYIVGTTHRFRFHVVCERMCQNISKFASLIIRCTTNIMVQWSLVLVLRDSADIICIHTGLKEIGYGGCAHTMIRLHFGHTSFGWQTFYHASESIKSICSHRVKCSTSFINILKLDVASGMKIFNMSLQHIYYTYDIAPDSYIRVSF